MRNTLLFPFVAAAAICLVCSYSSEFGLAAEEEEDGICPTAQEAVFPYWSLCSDPAMYSYSGGIYKLQSQGSGADGIDYFLAPEWDAANSTYYVRLVEGSAAAANYAFTHTTREIRPYVAVSDTNIIILNADTRRYLMWREEGADRFLVEAESANDDDESTTSLALFKFAPDNTVTLACPRVLDARCQAYDLMSVGSDPTTGLSPYEEDGVVYFTLAAQNLLPFTLLNATAT